MGTRYVVTVVRVEDVEVGESRYGTRDTTLFEATHQDPTRLARFAPEEVLAVLAEAGGVELTIPAMGPMPDEPVAATVQPTPGAVRFHSNATMAEAETPKRSRRTKAQKAADDEAQALGYRDAAHRAEMTELGVAGAQEHSGPGTPAGQEDASVVAGPWPTPQAQGKADPVPDAGIFEQPASASQPPPASAAEAPAAPFNPFG